jgi:nucleoid-associated protein YgaU
MHRPPRCQLWWGSYCLIEGVLTKMSEDFQYFLADGTPVRASLNCTFQEYVPYEEAKSIYELHSPDVHRTRTVRRGDTLSGIAQAEYNDASKWRAIARANGIHDPRAIRPGQVLTIPKLR